ncbi:AAA family ATPase [Streptomyces sp. MNU76]|uniref:ATP-binding protein n=1 Tax=Streptomyces sp. MNU76 TaxID=2560026 RepID=UPI001E51F442|nr:AAA family ATPase [Streptomyces sp. MNU76]MCC9707769.1 AAA family ATPase [Streptomyces sp. MNU76]
MDRFALQRAAAAFLARTARAGDGLVVALDDVHWADPASLELLDHLVRHPPRRAPVVIVVARRERQTAPRLAASLTRGVEGGTVLRLEPGPLDRDACLAGLAPAARPVSPPSCTPPARATRRTSSPCSRPAGRRGSALCCWTN